MKKITGYITRKVADKLSELFQTERDNYESKWNDLSIFVKYGMISDEKFYEKATTFALFKTLEGKYKTIDEYIESVYEMFFALKYYGGWSFTEAYNLPIPIRDWVVKRLVKQKKEEAEQIAKASRGK